MRRWASRRGFSWIEVAAVVLVVICVASVFVVMQHRAKRNAGIIQRGELLSQYAAAMGQWSNDHRGSLPLPSELDRSDTTVGERGRAKDTSANIASVLIFNKLTRPDGVFDPWDPNPNIEFDANYTWSSPPSAVRPKDALWDPAFNADFTGRKPGNLSWAMMQPAGGRLSGWRSSWSRRPWEPIAATRGAEVASIGGAPKAPLAVWANPSSLHLSRGEWFGHVASAHGGACGKPLPFMSNWRTVNGVLQPPDCFFLDEPADATHSNDFLGIFTTAGVMPADFKAIWD